MKKTKIIEPKEKKTIGLVMDVEKLNQIYALADKRGINRSQFMRNLIDVGFDLACVFEVTGILPAANFGVYLFDRFKNAIKNNTVDIQGDKATFPIK